MRIKMLIMAVAVAATTAACATGPAKSCWPVACPDTTTAPGGVRPGNPRPPDNRPPNRPTGEGPGTDEGWITFFAEVLDDAGAPVNAGESGTVTAAGFEADLTTLATDWTNADTGQPGYPVHVAASYPAAISLQPGPKTYLLTFTASAFLPSGWVLYCHVHHGKITLTQGNTVTAPVISWHKSLPAGPGLGASSVFCTYPELPTGVEPPHAD